MSLHFQLERNTLGFLVSPWIKSTELRSNKHEGQASGPALPVFHDRYYYIHPTWVS